MERVMVVDSARVAGRVDAPFSMAARDGVMDLVLTSHHYMDRGAAEQDPAWRQVIPYVLVRHASRWLLLRRTSRQTETRLHHRWSLGVGGHVNPSDLGEGLDPVIEGMKRELEEEIYLEGQYTIQYIGVLCDDTDAVSTVHLGLVFVLTVDQPGFTVMEPHKMEAAWASPEEILAHRADLETWSRILVDSCEGLTSTADGRSGAR